MQKLHEYFSTKKTLQTEPIPGKKQVKMRSGGYGFAVDKWVRLERFLVLGTEGGTYYASAQKLTYDMARGVRLCIKEDGPRVVRTIAAVSQAGRAAKNDPALYALAMCAKLGDQQTATDAYQALPLVARIGTHLFHFVEYCKAFGGLGGGGFKRAIGRWYTNKDAARLAYQLIKYQQRDGWSHRDLLRLAHPQATSDNHNALFHWAVRGWEIEDKQDEPRADMLRGDDDPLKQLIGFELIKRAETAKQAAQLVQDYNLPRECVPTEFLNDTVVWEALLPTMPITALIRNLGKMTSLGMVTNTSAASRHIQTVLGEQERLIKGRVHPMSILVALKTYAQGRGFKGSLTWQPAGRVVDALDAAFYLAFKAVKPTGKRLCLGLDISGSMGNMVSGQSFLTCYEAEAAMALVTANVETSYEVLGFTAGGGTGFVQIGNRRGYYGNTGVLPLSISPRQRLDDVVRYMQGLPMGGTDATLPIRWALANKIEIDAFVTFTDNESWAGPEHVTQSLKEYRDKMGIPAKLVAVAFATNEYAVADPDDAGQMNVCGMDTATPNIISDFISD